MDLSRFSIDAALSSAADASNAYRSIFYERLLANLFENDENLFVRTDIKKERAQIFTFPALYWLSRSERPAVGGKALYLCQDEETAATACAAAIQMAESLEGMTKPVLLDPDNAKSDETRDASLLVASIQKFAEFMTTGSFKPRDFGFIIADQADLLAELPGEFMRKIQSSLLPSWERKSLVIANRHTPRAKSFAWDFSDNPKELKLGESMALAGTKAADTRKIEEADKIRFLLHLLLESENHQLCVFCNLKSTAIELSARLVLNGVASDYIAGNLNPDRKNQIVTKALTWNGQGRETAAVEPEAMTISPAIQPLSAKSSRFPTDSFILVLTDDGAKGLNRPEFSSVVNYDMPLEPELYFDRLAFLDREKESTLLYNLVCERYIYGVPAIEQMIQKPLAPQTLDPSLVLPEDLSAGKEIHLPERRFNRWDDRRGHENRTGRSERTDRGYRRDDRPGIERDGRRHDSRGSEPLVRHEDKPSPEPRNPYSMSMEERLALYKKRYGKAVQSGSSGWDEKPRSAGEQQARQKADPRTRPIDNPQPTPAADSPAQSSQAEREDSPQNPGGIFSKLQNLFGARKE